jgi:hypothetical protein
MIRMIKLKRIRWVGHISRTGDMRSAYNISVGKAEGRGHVGDLSVDGRITLKWIFYK